MTSRWHAERAKAAFRLLLRGGGVRVTSSSPPEPWNARAALRELALWPLLPAQLLGCTTLVVPALVGPSGPFRRGSF